MTQTLHRVAVIGGGTMGAGIAEVAASAGHSVLLYDISAEAITRAIEGIRQRLDVRVGRGKISAEQASELLARISPATELNQLADAQLVIEAASERLEIKKALFSQLAEICLPSTLLTSNTSSISITAIAAGVKHPERVAGQIFFRHFIKIGPGGEIARVAANHANADAGVRRRAFQRISNLR